MQDLERAEDDRRVDYRLAKEAYEEAVESTVISEEECDRRYSAMVTAEAAYDIAGEDAEEFDQQRSEEQTLLSRNKLESLFFSSRYRSRRGRQSR